MNLVVINSYFLPTLIYTISWNFFQMWLLRNMCFLILLFFCLVAGGQGIFWSWVLKRRSIHKICIKILNITMPHKSLTVSMGCGKMKQIKSDRESSTWFEKSFPIKFSFWVFCIRLSILYQGKCQRVQNSTQVNKIKPKYYSFANDSNSRVAQSQCLGGLLIYFSRQVRNHKRAIWYDVGLISCAFVSTATSIPYQLYAFQIGMKIHVLCTSVIYWKVIEQQ